MRAIVRKLQMRTCLPTGTQVLLQQASYLATAHQQGLQTTEAKAVASLIMLAERYRRSWLEIVSGALHKYVQNGTRDPQSTGRRREASTISERGRSRATADVARSFGRVICGSRTGTLF
jgi:hypothetical protein